MVKWYCEEIGKRQGKDWKIAADVNQVLLTMTFSNKSTPLAAFQ